MLKYLHIENIAVIEETGIEFSDGFNVLTGETGAGKSIIIDSINAVLGERTSKDLIRSGCDTASVTAIFGNLSDETVNQLSLLDIHPDEDGNILISRKLSLKGNGIIKINSKPVSAQDLRLISGELINIHGQHDSKALLNPEKHCGFVDSVAENGSIIDEYYAEFKNLNSIRREIESLNMDEDEKVRKKEMLAYSIGELEKADIKVGEIEELKAKIKIAENFDSVKKALGYLSAALSGDDDTDGIVNTLKISKLKLISLGDNSFDELIGKNEELISLCEDVESLIGEKQAQYDFLDFDINAANQRLDLLSRLMLKYGNSEEIMLGNLEKYREELKNISGYETNIDRLREKLIISKENLVALGSKLTNSRKTASKLFETQVCDVLSYLNMPNVKFKVAVNSGRYTKKGCDEVEFLISANLGEEPKPLSKIASGGELSRVMLAIISVLLQKMSVGTMIFDEIDAGISGLAAEKVAERLKQVASLRQVICITHLAQIAAASNTHMLIEKHTENGRTYTNVTQLDRDGRIAEIARIMSGSMETESLFNSAKELLDRSQTDENL